MSELEGVEDEDVAIREWEQREWEKEEELCQEVSRSSGEPFSSILNTTSIGRIE